MTPEEFRRHGHATVDWVADYLASLEDRPVQATVAPGDIRRLLPDHPPEQPEPFEDVLADLDRVVLPGVTGWQSPGWFAYFPANVSGPSILGELVSAGLGVQGMLWSTSPAATELETHVLDWLAELLDLPAAFRSDSRGGGVIQDSASSAVLCALIAARERVTGGDSNRRGVSGVHTVYQSSQTHSSVEKAVRIAGLGSDNLRTVAVDADYAMDPQALDAAIAADRAAGRVPTMVVATVGTTSTTALDPLAAIGEVCRDHGVWLHVDAAMAGVAAMCPELRWIQAGVEAADSYCTNPHKWLGVNFDCSAFWVAEREALVGALSILPDYLRNAASESGQVWDYRDWQIPLGRRFRALKLWFVLRCAGAEALRARIRRHVALAAEVAAWVDDHPDFVRVAPAPLGLVTFRHVAGEDATEQVLEAVNASDAVALTPTRLDGRLTLRLSIGSLRTERRHVLAAWDLLRAAADELAGRRAGAGR